MKYSSIVIWLLGITATLAMAWQHNTDRVDRLDQELRDLRAVMLSEHPEYTKALYYKGVE